MTRLPALFFGHGNPMNALTRNEWTEGWRSIGESLPRPRAILTISAHWYLPGTHVTNMATPPTIHDFGGFPRELFAFEYPAPGSPELAAEVQQLLAPVNVSDREEWGLDHGTWSVLCHVFPDADIPVVQLSIDETREPAFHLDLGRRLRGLRDDGVLIVGSGNIVHNLHTYAWGRHPAEPFEWTLRFDAHVRELLVAGDVQSLASYESMGEDAMRSVPTPEHYLPLLYVAATQHDDETATFAVEGGDGG